MRVEYYDIEKNKVIKNSELIIWNYLSKKVHILVDILSFLVLLIEILGCYGIF
jgi:hypothetical protein